MQRCFSLLTGMGCMPNASEESPRKSTALKIVAVRGCSDTMLLIAVLRWRRLFDQPLEAGPQSGNDKLTTSVFGGRARGVEGLFKRLSD
jgi:hypothetical protein